MNSLIENLQIIVLITSLILIVLLTSFTIIYKIRQYFPIKVNCWFCNENFKVPFEKGNSWTCPKCEQYNGFDEEGDYNEEIPAQRYNKNKSVASDASSYCAKSDTLIPNSNGLCGHCNRNQELKINLISSFEPKDEENYDEEIEEYKKQLEQSYQLCQKCHKVLKRRLNKVKTNILGSKLNKIASQGLKIIDQQMKKMTNSKPSKQKTYFSYVCYYTVIIISAINFCQILQTVDMSRKRLDEVLPSNVTYGVLIVVSYISALKQTLLSIVEYFLNFEFLGYYVRYAKGGFEKFTFESFIELENETKIINNNSILMQIVGLIMSVGLLSIQINKSLKHFVIVILWNIGQFLTEVKSEFEFLNKHFAFDLFMIGFCSAMFIMLRNNLHTSDVNIKDKKLHNLNDSFHRIYSENISDVSDDSESEEDISSNYMYSSSPKSNSPFNRLKASSLLSLNSYQSVSPSKAYLSNISLNSSSKLGYETAVPKQFNSFKSLNGNNSIQSCNANSNSFNNNFNNSYYETCPSPSDSLYYTTRSNNTFKHNPFEISGNVTQLFNTSQIKPKSHPVNVNSLNLNSIQLGSNRNTHSDYLKNPFLSNHMEERSPSSCSVRSSVILAPSRLNSPNFVSSVSQSSWVAGGFWSTSPQKRMVPPASQSPLSINFCPIVSRTSSQSSGFESQLGGGSGEQNSRESSIGDEVEKTSVFSEPIAKFYKSPPVSNGPYHQYGIRNMNHSNLDFTDTSNNKTFSLKNLTNDLPSIPKGRLLKNWIDNNNPMMLKVHQKTD